MLPKGTKRGGEITELEKLGAAVVVTSEIVVVRHGVSGGEDRVPNYQICETNLIHVRVTNMP